MHLKETRQLCIALVATVVVGVLLPGCGRGGYKSGIEGAEVKVGGLDYSVQMARVLNPFDSEDRFYLSGQSPPDRNRVYLGVFLRAENNTERELEPTQRYMVVDTQGMRYRPLKSESAFAFRPKPIPPEGFLPETGTPAAGGLTAGALLLFRIDKQSLQNEPLELIFGSGRDKGRITLDI